MLFRQHRDARWPGDIWVHANASFAPVCSCGCPLGLTPARKQPPWYAGAPGPGAGALEGSGGRRKPKHGLSGTQLGLVLAGRGGVGLQLAGRFSGLAEALPTCSGGGGGGGVMLS